LSLHILLSGPLVTHGVFHAGSACEPCGIRLSHAYPSGINVITSSASGIRQSASGIRHMVDNNVVANAINVANAIIVHFFLYVHYFVNNVVMDMINTNHIFGANLRCENVIGQTHNDMCGYDETKCNKHDNAAESVMTNSIHNVGSRVAGIRRTYEPWIMCIGTTNGSATKVCHSSFERAPERKASETWSGIHPDTKRRFRQVIKCIIAKIYTEGPAKAQANIIIERDSEPTEHPEAV